MMRALQLSIYEYHKSGGNLSQASEHLVRLFQRFRDKSRLGEHLSYLELYHVSLRNLPGAIVARWGPENPGTDIAGF